MDLNPEFAPIRNRRIRLDKVRALHAVDPGRDARAVGLDDVLVPFIALDHRAEGDHVRYRHEFVAPRLVVNGAIPIRLAEIALVARHFAGARHALRTDLKTGIDEAFAAGELDLEAHDKI